MTLKKQNKTPKHWFSLTSYDFQNWTSITQMVCWFAGAAIKKYHKLGGLNNKSLLSHSSRGWMSQIKVSAGSVSSKREGLLLSSVLGLRMAVFMFTGHSPRISVSKFPFL